MKRYILIIIVLLLGLSLRAQLVTYTCRYWFDQNEVQITTFSEDTWQAELDVGSLSDGLHTFHLQVADTSLAWCPPQSYIFLKLFSPESLLDSVDMSNLTYHCWFDQDDGHQQTGALGNGSFLFDVSDIEEGLHSVNVMLEGSALTPTQNYMFIKVAQQEPLIEPIDMSHLVYHCWFDRDYENQVIDSLSDGVILLDVEQISDGLHTVHVMLEGEALTSIQTYMFAKVSQQNSLIEPIDMTNPVYHCWFDQDYDDHAMDAVSNGVILFDVDNLTDGLHTIHILLEGEALTSTQTYMFYKKPTHQNFGIAKWQYYLNGDISQLHTTEFSPLIDTLDIVTLLPVEVWPVRSSCFHFHPNGDEPYLNAKNEVTFRFWSNDDRILEKSTFYVDYQVTQDIEADSLERNSTVCIAAPRDNQIQWYKLPLEYGDTVAFKTDKACTLQLFAPSGEEVYFASAGESMAFGGCHAFEDGDYYLAVHDVTGSGEEICLTYVYVHKYAILAYDVHLVGNGGCSTITFQGNGFNSLLNAYLVNAQNDTIPRLDIGHESNTTTTVTFNFYQVNLGVYDAVFEFFDETIRINGALEVQEPVDIVLTSSVSYPAQFLRNTACTYTYTITNNGNMSAYGVPIFVYISSRTENGISRLEFDGLNLVSVISDLNMDSLSNNDVVFLKEWSEEIGDDHHFFRFRTIDEDTGDSILVRSNFFYANLAPFETKSLFLKITANELLDVWMTIPNDTVQPITLIPNRGGGQYCCHAEQVQCVLDVACGVVDLANLVASMAGTNPADWATDAANCICSAISTIHSKASKVFCADEGPGDFFDGLRSLLDKNSILGWAMSCIQSFIPGGRIADVAAAVGNGSSIVSLFAHPLTAMDCITSFFGKKPNCPRGEPEGGHSNPVNSLDPNDIRGYLSESGSHYMRQEIQNIHYEVEFENDTTLATAAAHTIIVRDTLDATKFDLNSLATHSVTIGDKRLELNGEQNFARTLDMRPELYVIAQINQNYDPAMGIVEWNIQSLDPMTMEPTDNPYQGVLPVNYFGDGVGFIDYSVNLKQAFTDGTAISNRAGIIFDQEEVIMTPTWTNIVDAVKPISYIDAVTPMADSLYFSFVSEDSRSGVWYHTLYYRNDSTDQQWQVRKAQIFEDNFMLHLEDLQTTEYLVMAVDSAGNVEDKLMNAEYVFSLDSIVYYTLTVSDPQGCGEVHGSGTYVAGSHVTIEAIPDNDCYFVQWNDGITDNPRVVHLVQDTTFVAMFEFNYSEITQTSTFSQGYNWWSTCIEQEGIDGLEMLQEALGDNGVTIRSQASGYNDYYEGYGWYGSLSDINNESSYRVITSAPCSVTMTGNAAVPSQHPVTLSQGWTWIGYLPSRAMDINTALEGLEATQGDMVKSQQGYSDYYPGYGWFGSLNTVEPGMGLMYYSTNGETVTFTYPDNTRGGELKQNLTAENNHWKPNVYAYPDNMTVMATIELNGEELNSEHYELAAFANGECRGSVKLTYAEPLHCHVAFITISGKDAAELSFRLYDMETGMEYYDAEESLDFETNAIVGDAANLYVVHFRGTMGMDELVGKVQVYPNPVNAGERFSINVADDVKNPVRVEIVNALGVETLRATTEQTPATLTAPTVAGIYTLRITVEGKETIIRKLVVK